MKFRYSVEFETKSNETIVTDIIDSITNVLRETMINLLATNVMPKFEVIEE